MEQEKQVEKFDPSKLMDGVKDRIKATFVSLIPDTQWEQMCDTTMKSFFEEKYVQDIYPNENRQIRKPSNFEEIVLGELKEKAKEYIKELLNKPEYKIEVLYSNEKNVNLSEHLDAMVKEQMPELLDRMFKKFLADGISIMFSTLMSQTQNLNRY